MGAEMDDGIANHDHGGVWNHATQIIADQASPRGSSEDRPASRLEEACSPGKDAESASSVKQIPQESASQKDSDAGVDAHGRVSAMIEDRASRSPSYSSRSQSPVYGEASIPRHPLVVIDMTSGQLEPVQEVSSESMEPAVRSRVSVSAEKETGAKRTQPQEDHDSHLTRGGGTSAILPVRASGRGLESPAAGVAPRRSYAKAEAGRLRQNANAKLSSRRTRSDSGSTLAESESPPRASESRRAPGTNDPRRTRECEDADADCPSPGLGAQRRKSPRHEDTEKSKGRSVGKGAPRRLPMASSSSSARAKRSSLRDASDPHEKGGKGEELVQKGPHPDEVGQSKRRRGPPTNPAQDHSRPGMRRRAEVVAKDLPSTTDALEVTSKSSRCAATGRRGQKDVDLAGGNQTAAPGGLTRSTRQVNASHGETAFPTGFLCIM